MNKYLLKIFLFIEKCLIKAQRIVYCYPRRPMMKYVKENLEGELTGVEIGSWMGGHAKMMLRELSIKKLYLIDPYIKYIDNGKIRYDAVARIKARKHLNCYKDKVQFIYKKSEDAVDDIPNGVDFIYIDGNHNYDYVKKDLELYFSKVRKEGVFGGHDFSGDYIDVIHAVLEFVNKYNLKLHTQEKDWWICK